MGVERQAAIAATRLLFKEPGKYVSLVVGLYLLSVKNPEQGKLLRSSYLFFRHVDDFLDEREKIHDVDKLSYILNLRSQIESNNFTGDPKVSDLAKYSISNLERKAKVNDNPRQDFLNGIDAIIFDYQRAKLRQILTSKEIEKYYHDTFFPVVNILLIGFDSQFRAEDIPELAYSQGRVYSIRDLEEDWQRGIINVPKEILQAAGLTEEDSIGAIKRNKIVANWAMSQLLRSRSDLATLKERLRSSGEKIIPMTCNGVDKTCEKLISRYENAHGFNN